MKYTCLVHRIRISYASFQMIPSPDWIVGVSNENLCLSNGSWTDHRTIDLYPADAGVDRYVKSLSLHVNIDLINQNVYLHNKAQF